MIGNPQEMAALTHNLVTSVWTLGAIGALFESGLVDPLKESCSLDDLAARCPGLSRGRIERCLGVAAAAGVVTRDGERYRLAEGAVPFAQPPMRAGFQGEIRTMLMQAVALLDSSSGSRASAGWSHTDRALLQSMGDASGRFAPMFKGGIVASLGDLAARLERPGARFLDVGVGVASLSIAMCRAFPELHVVGLDNYDVPLGIARENVARTGLSDRIELRLLAVEDLPDEQAFDLAWLPSFFIAPAAIASAVARVRAALRPGGWMVFPVASSAGDDRQRAVFALMGEIWGGPGLSAVEAESLLKQAAFSQVRTLPGPPGAPVTLVAER